MGGHWTRSERPKLTLSLLLVSIGSCAVAGAKQQFYKSDLLSASPYFTTLSKKYAAQVGAGVTLNCKVENLGTSTLVWKKDGRIISAGQTVIRKDTRMALHGQSLEILEISEEDAGEYICEVETFGPPLDQVHTLEVLVPPLVQPKPKDGRFVVRKGSTISLECSARGNPPPTITWTRTNNMLPSGEKSLTGVSIVIQEVSRHHTGLYICTADNGVGQPSSAEIDLQVLYPPEIAVDQTWIKTKEGIEAEVSCNVHGEPQPEVKWYKETMLLDPTNNRHMETYGNRHVLILRHVNEYDFGNYSCMADNSLGRERKSIEVSGRPHPARVISPNVSFTKDQYNLTWTVDSFIKIDEYRILYRVLLKNGQEPSGFHGPPKHTEWTNIIPTLGNRQLMGYKNSFTYTGSFNFFGLEPATQYEVIIQSRNREGWSDPSEIFKFSTRPQDYDPRELELQKAKQQQGYLSSAHAQLRSSHLFNPAIVVAAILISHVRQV